MINRFYGSISEKNGNKYLTIPDNSEVLKKYEKVFSGILIIISTKLIKAMQSMKKIMTRLSLTVMMIFF